MHEMQTVATDVPIVWFVTLWMRLGPYISPRFRCGLHQITLSTCPRVAHSGTPDGSVVSVVAQEVKGSMLIAPMFQLPTEA